MNYFKWNDIIAKYFFNPEEAGKEILLYVNKDIIEELGQSYSCGLADFIDAVKAGPGWTTRSGFCQMALQACINWRKRDLIYPPYIAYLACFVLAAGTDVDVRADAYYPRLKKLLNLQDDARFPSFDRMHVLWEDLEKWTREDKHEEWGRFIFGIRGNMIWVGLPRFQTLISAEERKNLALFFSAADLDPADSPSHEVVLKQLIYYGDHLLQRKTKEVLNSASGDNKILKEKLLEFIMDELEEWDGSVPEQDSISSQVSYSVQSGLRLCMAVDTLAHRADFTMRLKTNRQFSGEELFFCTPDLKGKLVCKEPGQGWSKVIRTEGGECFNAAQLNWEQGIQLEDTANKWKAKLKGTKVRLFISGKNEGFSGWVESQRLERGIPFMVAACGENIERVRIWGQDHCNNFMLVQMSGMPGGWILFEGSNADDSCPGIDVLTLSSTVRLAVRGGIKIRGGNTYLCIAPPLIALENCSGTEVLTVNGKPLVQISKEVHLWSLPEDTRVNEILRIEVNVSGKMLLKILRLEEPVLAENYHSPWRDTAGNIIQEPSGKGTTFSGAIAHVEMAAPMSGLEFIRPSSQRCIYFVGAPGQICEWPAEKMPSWNPEWALEKTGRKEWTVTYCRKSLDNVSSDPSSTDRQLVRKWKELVWFNRKKNKLPGIPLVKKRWLKYVEVAQNV
jgi:hypothetical protein